jgi:hypothetical protein
MNSCMKYISIFVVELFVVLLFSTNAFTAIDFYFLPNDYSSKVDCEFLEINNNQVFCTANNLLITYDIAHVKLIEVVHNGTSQYFQNFTKEKISIINKFNSDKSATETIKKQEDSKKKIFGFIPDSAQSLINNFKIPSGSNLLNTILAISGLIVFLIGSVAFLIATFREGILWGLSCMFFPFFSLVFLFVHWKTVRNHFLYQCLVLQYCF